MCANWAAGVDKQFRDLGMGSPFVSFGIGPLDSLGFMSRSGKVSICRPGLPLPMGQSFAHITIGLAGPVICDLSPTMSCQWASVNSGLWCSSDMVPMLCSLSRAVVPGQPSRATFAGAPFCDIQAVGDELHCVVDCPHFSNIRAHFPGLFQDAAGCMRMFTWHKDQKSVCHCLIALLQKAQT